MAYKRLPERLSRRSFTLREAADSWGLGRGATWQRLNRLVRSGELRHDARAAYAPVGLGKPPQLPDHAREVLVALDSLSSYRMAISGLDVLTPHLHYLPARYAHLLLLEERALEDTRRALARAGYLAVPMGVLATVWSAEPPVRVVALKPNANWHGVSSLARNASVERAFLDLLVAVRRRQYPYPEDDLQRMWHGFDLPLRERVSRLGRALQIKPFYGVPLGASVEPVDLRVLSAR